MSDFSALHDNLMDAATHCEKEQNVVSARLKQAATYMQGAHNLAELTQDLLKFMLAGELPNVVMLERLQAILSMYGFTATLEDTMKLPLVKSHG
jgi:hypothetical protein